MKNIKRPKINTTKQTEKKTPLEIIKKSVLSKYIILKYSFPFFFFFFSFN